MITINISDENWESLNKRKKRGESFDEVISRMLLEEPELKEETENENKR
jgi:predicted CopG family antitoxin